MRFHVVGLPHTKTTKEYNACAYTQKVYNFCKMMFEAGHEVYHYGTEDSNPPCTEHITIMTNQEQRGFFGDHDWKTDFFNIEWDWNLPYWQHVNKNAAREINKRKQKKDFVCLIAGLCQKQISDLVTEKDTITVEYGVGYHGTFARFKAFESYAQMHKVYVSQRGYDTDGANYDVVIPNYYDLADYPYVPQKEDYYLYIGRFIGRKGIEIAVQTTKAIGAPLIMAGQGMLRQEGNKFIGEELTVTGDHIKHVGYANIARRSELMGKAKAVFVPTFYLGPFEGVTVEAMLHGTPVLTSDWGAFAETVQHGVTGYRCRTLEQWIYGAQNVDKLDTTKIRNYAAKNYSNERVYEMFNEWFNMLLGLWGKGWPTIPDQKRVQLDWLNKHYE